MFVGTGRKREQVSWTGTAGLADDIRYYGNWMREEAYKRIGEFYPKVKTMDGTEATVIAWLWARTVPCANPACRIAMPLTQTFQLSKKRGNEYWARPVVDRKSNTISFEVQNHDTGVPDKGTVNRNGAICVACKTPVRLSYVREQVKIGKMGETMTAIVAEGDQGRLFLSPTSEHIQAALSTKPARRPRQAMPNNPTLVSGRGYGITHWHQLFTERQLMGLTTFSDLLEEIRPQMTRDGAPANYADVLCTYLTLAIGRMTNSGCTGAVWETTSGFVAGAFARQAIAMVWDFAEANPFSSSTQNWLGQIKWISEVIERFPATVNRGEVYQADAATTPYAIDSPVVVTDPPYYDNIDYADLSDFFYVWLRKPLRGIYPELFAGMLTPKSEEMVANARRFKNARGRFEELQHKTLQRIRERCSDQFPSSIFYAYKQQEEETVRQNFHWLGDNAHRAYLRRFSDSRHMANAD